ncbi:MAG: hypothetical protein IH597_14925 [Bacteroidales bacterium]|nr:hypothetical protein [Bacteroidales bacterium]
MKKFFLALMVLSISFSALGLNPPRDHTPTGHSIIICDDFEQALTITTGFDQASTIYAYNDHQVMIMYDFGNVECFSPDQSTKAKPMLVDFERRTWQPPGELYELFVTAELANQPILTSEMQQNSIAILYVTDQLSDLQPENLYNYTKYKRTDKLSEATFWNHVLFRSDRSQYV